MADTNNKDPTAEYGTSINQIENSEGRKKSSYCPSFGTIISTLLFVYVGMSFRGFYYIMNPLKAMGDTTAYSGPTVDPLWQEGTKFAVKCYISQSKQFHPKSFNFTGTDKVPLLVDESGLSYNNKALDRRAQILLVGPNGIPEEEASACEAGKKKSGGILFGGAWKSGGKAEEEKGGACPAPTVLDGALWRRLLGNGTVHLHVVVTQENFSPDPNSNNYDQLKTLHGTVPLVKLGPHPNTRPIRYLLNDVWRALGWHGLIKEDQLSMAKMAKHAPKGTLVPLWKPEIAVKLVNDFTKYPAAHMPESIRRALQFVETTPPSAARSTARRWRYLPPMHSDEIGLTSDRYVVLNRTVRSLPLEVSVAPMSIQRWLLMAQLEGALAAQVEMLGFSERDVDDVRNLVGNTNVPLLAITMIASMLHLLFEFLAFKSDVNFWRKNKTLKGLSPRSVVIELFSQIVIFMYLLDVDTSLLVTIPAFVGILIQVWKVKRATGIKLQMKGMIPTVVLARLEQEEKEQKEKEKKSSEEGTMQLDRVAIKFMSKLLLPLAVSFSVKSLVFDQHPGWYSWAVASLTGCVYTFGFVLMTPQLYINYKLKSVAHLPWRFLCYRFVNTFIDDLFAFIIKMPTMHRVSCFRDDVVFLIYIYQRWIYPVDSKRAVAVEDTAGH